MEASAINEPHPDDAANEAEAFFGGGEPDAATDPGPFEPEPAKSAGGPPTLSPEAAQREAEEYRRERGEPTERAFDHVAEPSESADPTPTGDGGETGSTTEQAAPASDAADGDSDTADSGNGSGKQSGAPEREYRVFQKLPLTKRILEHLLKQLEENGGEPRVAYFEIGRTEQRNVKGALAHIYKQNKQRLGQECDLAAVSTKALQERHVKPRARPVEEDIEIS